jgi:hypothetical protein
MPTASTAAQQYLRTPTGFVMVQYPDDDVLHELKQLAIQENISGASRSLAWGIPPGGIAGQVAVVFTGGASPARLASVGPPAALAAGHPAANGRR